MIKQILYGLIGCILFFMNSVFAQVNPQVAGDNGGSGVPGNNDVNNNSIRPELDAQYIKSYERKDFRLMDDVLFPSWQPKTADTKLIGSTQTDSRSSLRKLLERGNHYVVGVIGTNNDQFLIMDFFSRIADIMIVLITPILFMMLIYNGILWITDTGGANRTKVSGNILNSVIGLVIVVCAYSLVKIIYFTLTQ